MAADGSVVETVVKESGTDRGGVGGAFQTPGASLAQVKQSDPSVPLERALHLSSSSVQRV